MTLEQMQSRHTAFAAAYNAGDLDALVAMYEPAATLVPGPGAPPVSGLAIIRTALANFLALKGRMELTTLSVTVSGELALARAKWTLVGTGPDGKPLTLAAESYEVQRRQADGSWRIVIDVPFANS
jgi:uncharacterized protein (TIGR02246 family)